MRGPDGPSPAAAAAARALRHSVDTHPAARTAAGAAVTGRGVDGELRRVAAGPGRGRRPPVAPALVVADPRELALDHPVGDRPRRDRAVADLDLEQPAGCAGTLRGRGD